MQEKNLDIRKAWTIHQDQAILSIVQQIGTKNWPLVSQLMKEKYFLPNRSGKQCRQRWHNQLNPELNKRSWTEQEQQKLFEAHRKYGNRWIQISKQFGGRTDNSIKNYFYSTIRRSMRRICKIIGNRNSTSKLRDIRPSILSQIFQFSKTHPFKSNKNCQNFDIASCLLQYAKQKPSKSIQFDPESKDDLCNLIKMLVQLNDSYVQSKQTKKTVIKQIKPIKMQYKTKQKIMNTTSDQFSQTNSSINHHQQFEKQYKEPKIQKSIEIQKQQQIEVDYQEQSIFGCLNLPKIYTDEIERQYLIINPFKMPKQLHLFNSTECFNEDENYCFQNIQKPSVCEIEQLDWA